MGSTLNFNPPASSAAVQAAVYRHPLCGGDPRRGENSDPERGTEQVKCVPDRTEAEFHEAFDRRGAFERTREPGERIGVRLEDGGGRGRERRGRQRPARAGMEAHHGEELFPRAGATCRKMGPASPSQQAGFALQMCALRPPDRLLASGKFVPQGGADFIACRCGNELADYGVRAATRQLRQITAPV